MNVERRIAGVQLQPKFPMAGVGVVATDDLHNINRGNREMLVHRKAWPNPFDDYDSYLPV